MLPSGLTLLCMYSTEVIVISGVFPLDRTNPRSSAILVISVAVSGRLHSRSTLAAASRKVKSLSASGIYEPSFFSAFQEPLAILISLSKTNK